MNETERSLTKAGKKVAHYEKIGFLVSEEELNKRSWEKQFHRKRKA